MTPAAVGTPITLVVDHLTPDTARRILAIFDRQRGTPLSAGQAIDLHSALSILPHGNDYGMLIGVWTLLSSASRDAWMADGRAHIHASTAPMSSAAPPAGAAVTHERRGRGQRVVLRGAFGRGKGTR